MIIQGARQVGKTWAMLNFGRENFAKVAYINFDNNQTIIVEAQDNIITKKLDNKADNEEQFPNILQIAKIFCFKKILKDQAQKNSDMNDESNPAIFIQKEII